jgi:cytochrome c oxidase subunit II
MTRQKTMNTLVRFCRVRWAHHKGKHLKQKLVSFCLTGMRSTKFERMRDTHPTHFLPKRSNSAWTKTHLLCWLALFLTPFATAQDRWPWRDPNALEPTGPIAGRITELWWFLFTVATIVFIIVTILLIVALVKRKKNVETTSNGNNGRARGYILFGTALTTIILIGTAIYSFIGFNVFAAPLNEPRYQLEFVGKQWWWEIRYEGETIGANELHIPVGETVAIELVSDNVIHSFWVPQLAGKRDLMPGKTNTLYLRADEPGIYRGICAEFCGVQHALMGFVVVAEEVSEFEAWLEQQRSPISASVRETYVEGHAIFQNQGCAGCHAIRGTEANGHLGPDLTHLASRLTLGAGTLPNTRGHLGGWVVNAQAIKPGNYMPPQPLASNELQVLLDYLEALE